MSTEKAKPIVGIKPWGTSEKTSRKFEDDVERIPFMRLQPGMNNVRIVTGFGTYYVARWKHPKAKSPHGDKVRTSYPTYEDCPVKKYLGLDGKERHMVIVIDRADGELKLLDLSQLTKEQIENNLEVKNQMRQDGTKVTPRDFDISIKFNPKSKVATGFYGVVAHDSSPMSEKDLALVKDIGGDDMLDKILGKQLLCPKPETVMNRLKGMGWDGSIVKTETDTKKEELEAPVADDYSFQRPEGDVAEEAVAE